MKVLLVGAGAVGQVYGYFLKQGGASVAFHVKEKHAEEARRGYSLYPLNRRKARRSPVKFDGFEVLTSLDDVKARTWDQVYLCMSSTGLRGEWTAPFLRSIGDATVVFLQPGLDDREYLGQWVPEDRLVQGSIPIVSYHAPLPGEKVPEP